MKTLAFICFLLIFSAYASGQDRIITHNGDTIKCIVFKVNKEFVYFTLWANSLDEHTLLPQENILKLEMDFYGESSKFLNSTVEDMFPHYRISLSAGFSNRIKEPYYPALDPVVANYVQTIRHGVNVDVSFQYFLSRIFGLGMQVNTFHTDQTLKVATFYLKNDSTAIGMLSDNVNSTFISPTATFRYLTNNNKHSVLSWMGVGETIYRSNGVMIKEYKAKGSRMGILFGLAYDYSLNEHFGLGCTIQILGSHVGPLSYSEDFSNHIQLYNSDGQGSHWDFNIGVHYQF